MSRIVQFVALLLVFCLTPGAAEIVENVAHLATDGHMAHAIDDGDHAPEGDEHGCSGTVHLCACHSSTCFTLADAGIAVPSPLLIDVSASGADEGRPTRGHALGVYRPPAA